MQINFYSNKEGIIELFNWIKKEFPDLDFYSWKDNARFNDENLRNNDVGYYNTLYLTLKDSLLSKKMISYEKCGDIECTIFFKNSIEFGFGYSDDKIYNYDFTNYNPYNKNLIEPFYPCRIWLDSYYLSGNEIYTKIYRKICSKIRRNSIRLQYDYVEAYLYSKKTK